MTSASLRDPRFGTGQLVRLTAAVAGISRTGWMALKGIDATESAARAIMAKRRFDVLPIESGRSVEGYFHTVQWNDYSRIARASISEADLIPYDTDIREVIKRFAEQSRLFCFLQDDREVVGLMSVVNLNRRPVKVWLFSLLSEIEVRLGELICHHLDDQELYTLTLGATTDPKYDQVRRRYQADRIRGLELPVVEYLYFSDLIGVAHSRDLHAHLDYSQSRFKRSMGSLVELRDEVAHPTRSLVRDPGAVRKLWRRVERIEDVLGRLRRGLTSG